MYIIIIFFFLSPHGWSCRSDVETCFRILQKFLRVFIINTFFYEFVCDYKCTHLCSSMPVQYFECFLMRYNWLSVCVRIIYCSLDQPLISVTGFSPESGQLFFGVRVCLPHVRFLFFSSHQKYLPVFFLAVSWSVYIFLSLCLLYSWQKISAPFGPLLRFTEETVSWISIRSVHIWWFLNPRG